MNWINAHWFGSRKDDQPRCSPSLRRAMLTGPMSIKLGTRVPWNYDLDDVSQAVETGGIADRKQDGFFPASIEVHRLQTTTHTYSTPFAIYVNCHSCHLLLAINHPFHPLVTSPNSSFFMFILSLSCTFLHTKPLDNWFSCTFLFSKIVQ